MRRSAMLAAGLAAAAVPGAAQVLAPVPCLIEPADRVELSTSVAGVVADVAVDRGDVVEAGQIVARLDTSVEEIALELARARANNPHVVRSREARLAFLQAQAERNLQLAARNATSAKLSEEAQMEASLAQEELEEARLDRRLAEIEARQTEAILNQKIVRSPIAGVVVERMLSPGEYREDQAPILTIARIDTLRVEAFAPLSYHAALKAGRAVTVTLEAPIGGRLPAVIEIVDRVFDAATATIGFRARLANPDLAIPAGLRCMVEFDR